MFKADTALLIKEWLGDVFDKFDKDCFESFKNFDIKNYQDIDKTRIVMLKLEMKVINDLRNQLFSSITVGDEAMKKIRETDRR